MKHILFLFLSLTLLLSCSKKETTQLPTVSTASATNITSTSATCGGNISSNGQSPLIAIGVCWSTTENPTISDNKTVDGINVGTFTSNITGLSPGNMYFIRSYAINNFGISYGNQIVIKTSATMPSISTLPASNITSTSITSGGSITKDGGSPIIVRGVCYSVNQNPTTSDNKTIDGTDIGNYTSSITGLTTGTTYYIRAYSVNSAGTSYGDQIIIKTKSLPSITTTTPTSIATTSTNAGGNISDNGGDIITSSGVCWSINQNPTISDNRTSTNVNSGVFTSAITGLTPNTTYYIRAYATNSVGTSYGDQIIITTNQTVAITNGLVAYYPFNGNANDESGNNNNGIIYGATLTSDRFGNNRAYSFNGINNFISVNHNDLLNSFPITINVWCKNFSQSATVITKYIGCSNDGWEINVSNFGNNYKVSSYYYNNYSSIGYINFDTSNGNVIFAYDNNWHMITAIYDNDGGKIFLDNNLILTKTFTEASKKCINTESMVIGKNIQGKCGNTGYYKGLIDDIRIYNRSLTQDEITLLYNEK